MKKWVLIVGYNLDCKKDIRQECMKYGMAIHMLSDMIEAIKELVEENSYLLVVLSVSCSVDLRQLKVIRRLTQAPVLVMSEKYDGVEKIAAIEAGADEYIQRPKNIRESLASCYALIRRFTGWNCQNTHMADSSLQGNIIINEGYHRIYVHEQELSLTRQEFSFFCLLASNPNRVFTHEQLFQKVWGSEYVPTENCIHSCVRRIRRKLEGIPRCTCTIENLRGIGYSFHVNTE